jgi:hypothetical protein
MHEYYANGANGAQAVAVIDRKVCGVEKNVGKGRATVLGTIPNYQIVEHLDVFKKFLDRDGILPDVFCDHPDVFTILRKGDKGSFIFVLNFHPVEKECVLEIRLGNCKMRMPSVKTLKIPATSGWILPVDFKIEPLNVQIVYSTSELLNHQVLGQSLKLDLKGPRGTLGEILIQSDRAPQNVALNGKKVSWVKSEKGYLIKYRHPNKKFSLEVNL